MPRFVYLCSILTSLLTLYPTTAQEVALGFNTNLNESIRKLPLKGDSFLELISKNLFVDKTLLIKEIFTRPRQSVISCPRRWGKTINLDMLKKFVEMQVHPNGSKILPISSTPNYQLFVEGTYSSDNYTILLEKPLLISDKKYKPIVDQYLGQYPTIHLSFAGVPTDLQINNYTCTLKRIIREAFHRHRYMLELFDAVIRAPTNNTWNKEFAKKLSKRERKFFEQQVNLRLHKKELAHEDKKKFIAYLNDEENDNFNISASVRFLSKKLHDHFQKKVFIFIEDYDRLLSTSVSVIIQKLLLFTLKYNEFLHTAVLTGTLPVSLKATDVEFVKFFGTPIQAFYGFTMKEMELLYRYYQIPEEEQRKIEYWYGGYRISRKYDTEVMMNPWSVCNYITSRQFKSYQRDIILNDIHLNQLCEFPEFQYRFSQLISGKNYWITFEGVSGPLPNQLSMFSKRHTRLYYALRYLIEAGHVAKKGVEEFNLRIPNYENFIDLQMIFTSKLNRLFEPDTLEQLKNLTAIWERFLFGNESTSYHLQNHLRNSYESSKTYAETIYEFMNDDEVLIHTVVMSIATLKQFSFISWQFTPNLGIAEVMRRPDIVLSSEVRGVIFDIKQEGNVSSAMNETSRYISMLREYPALHGWKDIKFVFCNLLANGSVEIISNLYPIYNIKLTSDVNKTID